MLRIIRFLVTGDWHLHKWEIIGKCNAGDEFGQAWTRFYVKCSHCGRIKHFD